MKHLTSKPVTVPEILDRKHSDLPLVAITAYDFTTAQLVDQAGVDLILVGDSVGTVFQGNQNTLAVTLDQMIYHCSCVTKGVNRALVIGDMPFMSYQVSAERAIETAGRLVKEGGVAAVKLEGGVAMADTISRITKIDIPVVGHIGLTPQSYHRMGGHKVQGRNISKGAGAKESILADAKAVQDAGAFLLVVEGVPQELAAKISSILTIPTIGIGAGLKCDGQILVINDLLGLSTDPLPKFVKRYANLREDIVSAVTNYASEVRNKKFPDRQHTFSDLKILRNTSSKVTGKN